MLPYTMSWFPEITRPCPIADRLDAVLRDADCGHCGKTVHDLNHLSEEQRRELLGSANDELCVRYSRPIARAILTSVALGSGALAHAEPPPIIQPHASASATTSGSGKPVASVIVRPVSAEDSPEDMEIIVGGARRYIPKGYEYVETTAAEDRREEQAAIRAEAREQRRLAARARRVAKQGLPIT